MEAIDKNTGYNVMATLVHHRLAFKNWNLLHILNI